MIKQIANSLFSVDRDGNVYNPKGIKLAVQVIPKGYTSIKIKYLDGKTKRKQVHRLIAEAFISNPENKPQVNHINGIKDDNRVDNLEWVTGRENMRHASDVLKHFRGNNASKLTIDEDVAIKICAMLQDGYRNIDIERKFDIPRGIVKNIRVRKDWTHISKDYVFSRTSHKSDNLSDETFFWVCHQLQNGTSMEDICKQSGLQKTVVRCIKYRKIRRALSVDFKF